VLTVSMIILVVKYYTSMQYFCKWKNKHLEKIALLLKKGLTYVHKHIEEFLLKYIIITICICYFTIYY